MSIQLNSTPLVFWKKIQLEYKEILLACHVNYVAKETMKVDSVDTRGYTSGLVSFPVSNRNWLTLRNCSILIFYSQSGLYFSLKEFDNLFLDVAADSIWYDTKNHHHLYWYISTFFCWLWWTEMIRIWCCVVSDNTFLLEGPSLESPQHFYEYIASFCRAKKKTF